MAFALCLRRSASRLASSVCDGRVGRVRSISTVLVNRPSLVRNPSPLRPFVSRYSTAAIDDDWISSEQAILRVIDSDLNDPVPEFEPRNKREMLHCFILAMWKDRTKGPRTPPASFPFKVEDIPGDRTVTLTREYNGEHIKVVVSMPLLNETNDDASSDESNDDDDDDDDAPSNESNADDDDDAPSNESNDDDDDDYSYRHWSPLPLVVTVTKKSGRSLELSCRSFFEKIAIDAIHVNLPGHSPKVIRDMDAVVGMDHKILKKKFNKYLEIRGVTAATSIFLYMHGHMRHKMKLEYWLWLNYVKEFLEE